MKPVKQICSGMGVSPVSFSFRREVLLMQPTGETPVPLNFE